MAKYELPFTPGAEVAGVREDTGERVVALIGTGGYAEYAVAAEGATFPIPDGLDDGAALALLIQGLNAWHLYRTAREDPAGRVRRRARAPPAGVGSLAVQLGKPMGAGRRDRDRELGGEARAGARAGRRRGRRRRGPRA